MANVYSTEQNQVFKTLEQFREMKNGKAGFIVIVDNRYQEDVKTHYPHCYTVTEDGFRKSY